MSQPTIVPLSSNLFAVSFECMKMLPAKFILDQAMASGRIRHGGTVIETSSGTFARALATYSKVLGLRCIIVCADTIDGWLRNLLTDLGAELVLVKKSNDVPGGIQGARLKMLRQLRAQHPGAFWPAQYENPDNAAAYASLGAQLAEAFSRLDFVVGPCGTGGSTAGTARFLRASNPSLKLIGVDLPGSVLFGQRDEPRRIGGIGNSIMPRIEHGAYDVITWVPERLAIYCMRELFMTRGLYQGGSSGAAFAAARWWADTHPGQTGVVIFPDSGHRYANTFYSAESLQREGLTLESSDDLEPYEVNHPQIDQGAWTYLRWDRRALAQVLSAMS